MVDRARFDQHLVTRAIAEGAECRLSTPIREIRGDGTVVIGNGDIVRAKVIIGADGPRSRVGAAIGAVNEDIVESRQITVALNAPYFATDIFLRAEIAGGYAWLFPRGDVCNLGLGVGATHKADLKPLLDELHGRLVAEGRVGPEILKFTGGPIPVGGMIGPVGALGKIPVLLAGDAAGLVNPVTGAGIPAAVMSGQMAGEAATAYCKGDSEAADDYGDELATIFGPSLKLALHRRQQLLDLYRFPRLPGPSELKKGWIAFPEYWSADDRSFEIQTRHQKPEAAIAS
jgi:flavin-dependent dehydrogenase